MSGHASQCPCRNLVNHGECPRCICGYDDTDYYYGEQAQGHYNDGYKMGYAKGLIEGDSGGRKEGFRAGYAAGKDAVMTSSYEQAVAEGEREALSKWIDGVAKGRADAAKEVAELDLASCESMIEHISRWAAVNAARGTDYSEEGRNTE
jgi:hypothetical protein